MTMLSVCRNLWICLLIGSLLIPGKSLASRIEASTRNVSCDSDDEEMSDLEGIDAEIELRVDDYPVANIFSSLPLLSEIDSYDGPQEMDLSFEDVSVVVEVPLQINSNSAFDISDEELGLINTL